MPVAHHDVVTGVDEQLRQGLAHVTSTNKTNVHF
jgi:hypothetical protein